LRRRFLLLVVLAVLPAFAQESGSDPRVEAFIRSEMERQHVPGLAVGIVNGTSVSARGYGYANLEHQVAVTPETIFQSGSLGKMFTATAVMLQVEDGKLSLSDPISRFFPGAPKAWQPITVRHLLTHTSGIPEYTTVNFDYRRDYTEDDLLRLAFATKLDFTPGAKWSYSNTGYMLLGFIIGKASGKFYGDVLQERVFKPAGMSTARIISAADIVPNRAASYQFVNGEIRNEVFFVSPKLNTTADGALYLTLRDLIAWDAAVRRRAILRGESWTQIFTPVKLNDGSTYPYGFGWGLDVRGGQPMYHHGGSWQSFKTHLAQFIGDDLSIIVLANAGQAEPDEIVLGIAAILDPQLAKE
jgi:CubicO group peptidase (beta-lactamase class C family)